MMKVVSSDNCLGFQPQFLAVTFLLIKSCDKWDFDFYKPLTTVSYFKCAYKKNTGYHTIKH